MVCKLGTNEYLSIFTRTHLRTPAIPCVVVQKDSMYQATSLEASPSVDSVVWDLRTASVLPGSNVDAARPAAIKTGEG